MQYANSYNILSLFEGTTSNDHTFTCVLFGITPMGYYIVAADVANNFCIPEEWYMLKSFTDGKKKYHAGIQKKKS